MSVDPHKLLTVDEVSIRLRSSKKTIYRWVYERKIHFVKLNGKLLFEDRAITEMIARSRSHPDFFSNSNRDISNRQSSGSRRSRKGSLE